MLTRTTTIRPWSPVVLAALLWIGLGQAQAATIQWTAGSGSWHEPGNWNLGRVPAAGDAVVVNTGTAVTVTYTTGVLTLASLAITGHLVLSGGSLAVTNASQITGDLTVATGATLTATGSQAVLTVTGSATLNLGNLYALNGGRITLPAATHYLGPGVLRAQGTGSRLELLNLTNIGLGGGGALEFLDAVSREVSVFNDAGSGSALGLADAISREVSVFNDAGSGSALGLADAVSREVSVFNDTSGAGSGGVVIRDAVSREVSAFNAAAPPDAPILDAVSREVSVENQ
jgi:hypothetical protein